MSQVTAPPPTSPEWHFPEHQDTPPGGNDDAGFQESSGGGRGSMLPVSLTWSGPREHGPEVLHAPYLSARGSTHSPSAEMISGLTRTLLAHLLTQSCKRCLLRVYYVLRPALRLGYPADPTDMVPTNMGLTLKQGRWTVGGLRIFPARISRELWGCSEPALLGVRGDPPQDAQFQALVRSRAGLVLGQGARPIQHMVHQ